MTLDFENAFSVFLTRAQERVNETFDGPVKPRLETERGARYIRIVSSHGVQRSAWAFVDTQDGAVLKADGWKRPAKGARGNIYDAQNGVGRAYWTSVR